jgi:hypothetical protein
MEFFVGRVMTLFEFRMRASSVWAQTNSGVSKMLGVALLLLGILLLNVVVLRGATSCAAKLPSADCKIVLFLFD